MRKAHAIAKIDFVEMELSPFETTIEQNGVVDACKELGVKIFAVRLFLGLYHCCS